ncbi:uncharacterized protein LOC126264389 isoform X2 [Aethina tumida]|uniref:uncharacterized protein LOC126264389 isoform X2 n=1 Tax=Aethina tumida TaxID=116153 RepID=UPI0021476099|nr:uncharacterized protein LOC126264389 isoform X2 [Aethina tumida]
MTVIYESDSNAASNIKMKCIVNMDSGPIEWDSPQEKLNKYVRPSYPLPKEIVLKNADNEQILKPFLSPQWEQFSNSVHNYSTIFNEVHPTGDKMFISVKLLNNTETVLKVQSPHSEINIKIGHTGSKNADCFINSTNRKWVHFSMFSNETFFLVSDKRICRVNKNMGFFNKFTILEGNNDLNIWKYKTLNVHKFENEAVEFKLTSHDPQCIALAVSSNESLYINDSDHPINFKDPDEIRHLRYCSDSVNTDRIIKLRSKKNVVFYILSAFYYNKNDKRVLELNSSDPEDAYIPCTNIETQESVKKNRGKIFDVYKDNCGNINPNEYCEDDCIVCCNTTCYTHSVTLNRGYTRTRKPISSQFSTKSPTSTSTKVPYYHTSHISSSSEDNRYTTTISSSIQDTNFTLPPNYTSPVKSHEKIRKEFIIPAIYIVIGIVASFSIKYSFRKCYIYYKQHKDSPYRGPEEIQLNEINQEQTDILTHIYEEIPALQIEPPRPQLEEDEDGYLVPNSIRHNYQYDCLRHNS